VWSQLSDLRLNVQCVAVSRLADFGFVRNTIAYLSSRLQINIIDRGIVYLCSHSGDTGNGLVMALQIDLIFWPCSCCQNLWCTVGVCRWRDSVIHGEPGHTHGRSRCDKMSVICCHWWQWQQHDTCCHCVQMTWRLQLVKPFISHCGGLFKAYLISTCVVRSISGGHNSLPITVNGDNLSLV